MMGAPAAEMAAFYCHRGALLTVARFAGGYRVQRAAIVRALTRRIAAGALSRDLERRLRARARKTALLAMHRAEEAARAEMRYIWDRRG